MCALAVLTAGAPSPNFQLHTDKHFPEVEGTYVGDGSEEVLRGSS